jgi:hypothetical protein
MIHGHKKTIKTWHYITISATHRTKVSCYFHVTILDEHIKRCIILSNNSHHYFTQTAVTVSCCSESTLCSAINCSYCEVFNHLV